MENNKTVEDVVKAIFYSPATNGQAENSIRNGVKLINELLHQSNQEVVKLIEARIRDIEGNGHTIITTEIVRELTDLLTQISK